MEEKNHANDLPKEIICVACPKGCRLQVSRQAGEILVSQAGCKRGQQYAISEITDPRRMLATTVRMQGGSHALLPVYTSAPFPKGLLFDLLQLLSRLQVSPPVKMNQVILSNALGSGIDVLASRDLD